MVGRGNGFNIISAIIHDFLCYNKRMERKLSSLLEKSLDASRLDLIRQVAEEAAALGFPIYIIGGSVRDLALGRPLNDFDLTVEGDAIRLANSLASKHGGKVTAHTKFWTAKWFLPKHLTPDIGAHDTLDLISARSEIYEHPAALPTVKMGSMDDDIRRRDFTINTLAIRLDGRRFGELRDDLNGMDDLDKGILRVLHPRSFWDDPTRMYRAVRYAVRYGFQITEDTLTLIPEARSLIEKLSAQRIRHELDLMLEEEHAASMLEWLNELDLLKPIHPVLAFDESASSRLMNVRAFRDLQRISPWNIDKGDGNKHVLGWILWLIPLLHSGIESLNSRLQFTADLLGSLIAASSIFADVSSFAGLKPSQCVERLKPYPLDAIEAVYFVARDEKTREVFFKYLSEWRHVKPHTTGDDLKQRGLEPGPKYAETLRRLRAAWLDGEVKTVEEEIILLNNLLE